MTFLEQEKSRREAAVQAVAKLVSTQQQALSAAQERVVTTRTRVTEAQSQIPSLEVAAAAADARVTELDAQIEAHVANEPESTIEVDDGKPPRRNPAWRVWKRQLDQLVARRDQARADAAAAHGAVSNGQRAVEQAQMDVHSAERQVSETTAALQSAQSTLKAAQQQVADLERWRTEIARDPLDRTALEQVASELSARAMVLQESLTLSRFQQEDAESDRASLLARRDQLTATLADFNSRIPGAQAELQATQAAVDAASAELFNFLDAGQ